MNRPFTSHLNPFSFSLLALTAFALSVQAQATTVTVAGSPNPARYGSPVILTASVQPSTATGKVTFYAGTQVLGLAPLTGGVATLSSAQLSPGTDVITARYDGNGVDASALSAPVVLTVNAIGGGGFPRLTPYTVGQNPDAVATADFNGDGKLDLAITSGLSQLVYVLLGNGNGTFQAPVSYQAGSLPIAVAIADMNGDGKADLIVVNDYNGSVNPAAQASVDILLGNGNGTFQAPISYVTYDAPFSVVTGDFNGDGNVDVAVANESYSDLSIFLGHGDGTLGAQSDIATGSTTGAVALALGDFNGDGRTDIALASSTVVILTGNGDGTFTIGQNFAAGALLNDVRAADLNADGRLDLVTADYSGGAIDVLLGNGDATFQPAVPYPAQNSTSSVLLSDFNGDGKLDIIAANNFGGNTGTVSVFAGNGNGSFQPAENFSAGAGPFRMAQGDFNNDGIVDLAVADLGYFGSNGGGLSILPGGCFTVTPATPLAYDNAGGSQLFTLTALNQSCTWVASSTFPGLILSATSGAGNATVTATVPPNPSGADITGTISIAGATVGVTEAFTAQQFADVPPSAYYFDAVNLLKAKNITSGCTATDYCPTTPITRDQMAIFIVRSVYGSDNFPVNLATPYFSDVSPTTYGYKWIQKMYELGITTGCAPNLYCPTQQVSRDQMAVFIIRARYGSTTVFTYDPTPLFNDVPPSYFAFRWIQRMKQDNITSGCAVGFYCPSNPVTRGDMAIFVDRGAFNLLLPVTEPVISQVTPNVLSPGTSNTFTVTGVNTLFTQGTPVVVPTGGITASNVTVLSDTQFTVVLTASPTALLQPEPMYVQSTVEAVLPNAISVQ